MKPSSPVEAFIRVRKRKCKVSEVASLSKGRASLFFLKVGTKTSVHKLEVRAPPEQVLNRLRRNAVKVAMLGQKKLLVESKSCTTCRELARSDLIVIDAEQFSDFEMTYHVLALNPSAIKEFVMRMENKGIPVHVLTKTKYFENGVLTPKQFKAIFLAYQNGLFDVDRKTTVTQLASQLGLSTPTLAETLRRGVKKIVQEYLEQRYRR
ncbi:MAG: helix-turn-helix domain-containing protein [Conexivisphaerales archaeon]